MMQCKDIPDEEVVRLLCDPTKPSAGWTLAKTYPAKLAYRKLERLADKLAKRGLRIEYGTSLMTPWLEWVPYREPRPTYEETMTRLTGPPNSYNEH
jgi:hypothetical protein